MGSSSPGEVEGSGRAPGIKWNRKNSFAYRKRQLLIKINPTTMVGEKSLGRGNSAMS